MFCLPWDVKCALKINFLHVFIDIDTKQLLDGVYFFLWLIDAAEKQCGLESRPINTDIR